MNTPKHTPGPFSVSGIPGDNHVMAQTAQGRMPVCIVIAWKGCDPEEIEANKALFQSAPDLLQALEWMVKVFNSDIPPDPMVAFATIEKAFGAINKAHRIGGAL